MATSDRPTPAPTLPLARPSPGPPDEGPPLPRPHPHLRPLLAGPPGVPPDVRPGRGLADVRRPHSKLPGDGGGPRLGRRRGLFVPFAVPPLDRPDARRRAPADGLVP